MTFSKKLPHVFRHEQWLQGPSIVSSCSLFRSKKSYETVELNKFWNRGWRNFVPSSFRALHFYLANDTSIVSVISSISYFFWTERQDPEMATAGNLEINLLFCKIQSKTAPRVRLVWAAGCRDYRRETQYRWILCEGTGNYYINYWKWLILLCKYCMERSNFVLAAYPSFGQWHLGILKKYKNSTLLQVKYLPCLFIADKQWPVKIFLSVELAGKFQTFTRQ